MDAGWRRAFALRAERRRAGFIPRRSRTDSSVPQPHQPLTRPGKPGHPLPSERARKV
jgi:hypothetical protein